MNNEVVGISAELAIADSFEVPVSPLYRTRGDEEVKKSIQEIVQSIFFENNISYPIEHGAENQNPVDFILEGGKTLSVKSNQKRLGKAAPQIIGQPTNETYFDYLSNKFNFSICDELERLDLKDTYENRISIFKTFSVTHICEMLTEYWRHIFDCDYYLHFYNIINQNGTLTYSPKYIVLCDLPKAPIWDETKIRFTKEIGVWKESTTVKYYNISIGEFQAHANRNCLKFRFNLKGILKLLNDGLI